jgi:hypothetical protein
VKLQLMRDNALHANPRLKIFLVSAYTGDDLDAWYGWLRDELVTLAHSHLSAPPAPIDPTQAQRRMKPRP